MKVGLFKNVSLQKTKLMLAVGSLRVYKRVYQN